MLYLKGKTNGIGEIQTWKRRYCLNFFDTVGEKIDQKAPLDDYHDDTRSVNDILDNGQGGHLIREERSPRKFMKHQIRLL